MRAFVVDAFADEIFRGNQAGVVIPDTALSADLMQKIAAEFKHSETVFITEKPGGFELRYFTPVSEVELCGHATVSAFRVLRELGLVNDRSTAFTPAGELEIIIGSKSILMEMAAPHIISYPDKDLTDRLYKAYGLQPKDIAPGLTPCLASCGLKDILMPVSTYEALMRASQNETEVSAICRELDCVGVHMFTLDCEGFTAACSNFAPLYGIPEECATGTSNGALTYYLYEKGIIEPQAVNRFLQGEHMARPCIIESRIEKTGKDVKVYTGGNTVISMECDIRL